MPHRTDREAPPPRFDFDTGIGPIPQVSDLVRDDLPLRVESAKNAIPVPAVRRALGSLHGPDYARLSLDAEFRRLSSNCGSS